MKRKQSLIGGLDRILSIRDAFDLLAIPVDELLKFYAGQREISLQNLLWAGQLRVGCPFRI